MNAQEDQHWKQYAASMLVFSAMAFALTYAVLRLQHALPLNPQGFAGVPDRQAFETAASFTSNTNWQVVRWRIHNVVFHADDTVDVSQLRVRRGWYCCCGRVGSGNCAQKRSTLGNFWTDVVRATLYVLVPLSLLVSLLLVQQGAIQNFQPSLAVTTLEGATQIIPMGPVASQESIKQIGTNGGGFFNANSAHPFENPTPWTNFWEMLTIFAIPSALTYMLGTMVRKQKHGWAVWSAMFALFAVE